MFNLVPFRIDVNFEVRPPAFRFQKPFRIVHSDELTAETMALGDFKTAVERSMYSDSAAPRPRFVPGHVAGTQYLAITAIDANGAHDGNATLSIIRVSYGGKRCYVVVGFANVDAKSGDVRFTTPPYAPAIAYVTDPDAKIELY